MTDDLDLEEGKAAVLAAIDEMNAEWETALAAFNARREDTPYPASMACGKLDMLAARWILIFGGEEWVNLVLNEGLPLGHVLDDLCKLGHKLPSEVQAVRDQWYAGIVAYDMTRPYWERRTPEGREAGREEARLAKEAQEARKRARRARQRAPLPEDLQRHVDAGTISKEVARKVFVDRAMTKEEGQ